MARQSIEAQRLMQLCGVGETTATALLSTIGNGRDFKCGRQLCAWLGLVPGQYSSGGKQRLGRITKAGDPYLRSLLVLGARAVLAAAKTKSDPISRWAVSLEQRRGYWKAIVAIAAKNAACAGRCSAAELTGRRRVDALPARCRIDRGRLAGKVASRWRSG
jgi:transposase